MKVKPETENSDDGARSAAKSTHGLKKAHKKKQKKKAARVGGNRIRHV